VIFPRFGGLAWRASAQVVKEGVIEMMSDSSGISSGRFKKGIASEPSVGSPIKSQQSVRSAKRIIRHAGRQQPSP
jgi:hypothetical protein